MKVGSLNHRNVINHFGNGRILTVSVFVWKSPEYFCDINISRIRKSAK